MRTKLLISFLEDACCASSGFAGDVLMLMINDHDEDVDFCRLEFPDRNSVSNYHAPTSAKTLCVDRRAVI